MKQKKRELMMQEYGKYCLDIFKVKIIRRSQYEFYLFPYSNMYCGHNTLCGCHVV